MYMPPLCKKALGSLAVSPVHTIYTHSSPNNAPSNLKLHHLPPVSGYTYSHFSVIAYYFPVVGNKFREFLFKEFPTYPGIKIRKADPA